MGDQNAKCKHDNLGAYCMECHIEANAENAWLRGTLAIVRQYPGFDDGGPLAEMIDEALAGKKPELLKNIERIQANVRHNALAQGRGD